jgi:drug/metabolite transporter (DMT)-like permease
MVISCFWSVLILSIILIVQNKGFSGFILKPGKFLSYMTGALLNPVAYYLVLFASYDLLPAQIAQPLNYTWPLMLVLLSIPILKKKPEPRDGLSLLICLGGIILISRGGQTTALGALSLKGIILALFSSVLWAFYWLMGKRQTGSQSTRLFWNFFLALPVLYLLKPTLSPGFPVLTGPILFWTAWVGLFEMGITFMFWGLALAKAEHPARISHLVYLSPFLSLFWISLVLGESIAMTTIAGLFIIVVGILSKEIRFLKN